ncbi:uncharacterized protein LOC132061991 [Lycium ferocissimum]|uniref:uncharacterized protein LOC132061991 n=1 Tax=Lycium ferocissimum TaxID=112874 RepID=UPI00281601B9|nr:uncharacterized protein LOC132061991 [Lycium ferocissimum]
MLLHKEKEVMLNLEKWSLLEESALKQKSRAKWIQLGDGNNKYFHAVIKERTQRKQICELTSLTGTKLTEPEVIKSEILNFYKSLMGTSSHTMPAVDKEIMRKGPVLNHAQRTLLCREVTEAKIVEGLRSIGDDKSPGIDGYNSLFFKKAITNFFSSGKLYRAINCTAVTLIPKTPTPATVKEFRPIASLHHSL